MLCLFSLRTARLTRPPCRAGPSVREVLEGWVAEGSVGSGFLRVKKVPDSVRKQSCVGLRDRLSQGKPLSPCCLCWL